MKTKKAFLLLSVFISDPIKSENNVTDTVDSFVLVHMGLLDSWSLYIY